MLPLPVFWRIAAVYPTGTVDLMTMNAWGLTRMTWRMTDSTAEVSKESLLLS